MKPIIFNTEMIKAILAGRKTQTRRVVKISNKELKKSLRPLVMPLVIDSLYHVGDILWVRETFCEDNGYLYKANGDMTKKWTPSIFMPKKAARIYLKVIEVHRERLQSISRQDAIDEGMDEQTLNPEEQFKKFWDNLYIKQGYGWDTNPWVWVYKFEQIDMINKDGLTIEEMNLLIQMLREF